MSQYSSKKQGPPLQDLRQRVYTCIDKLSDRATLSQATNELDFIARNLPSDSLSSFISCILSVDSTSKSSVRVHCLNLLTTLSQTHHSFLSHHVPKLVIPPLLRRLREPDSSVRNAVVSAISSLSSLNFSALVGPLLNAVLTEQDGNAKIGACLCLKGAVENAGVLEGGDEGELRRVLPKLLKFVKSDGFKAKAALLGLIASIVGANHGGVVNNCKMGGGLIDNVVGCAVEMLSSDDWAARKAAAEVLEQVAIVVDRDSGMEVKRFVVNSLESRRFDKVKITRETMNRALEAWKEVHGGPEEDLLLARSNSFISKDNGNGGGTPPVSRRSSFAGLEAPKPRKSIAKTRSSLSGGPVAFISSPASTSTQDTYGFETPQRKKTLSKSRSSLSDDSTITDSSSVSKSSHDIGSETPQSKKPTSKPRSSLPDDVAATVSKRKSASRGNNEVNSSPYKTTECKKSLDWKVEIALPPTPLVKVVSEENPCKNVEVTMSGSEQRSSFFKNSEERVQRVEDLRSGSCVVPFSEEEESQGSGSVVDDGTNEEVGQNKADAEDLSLIRNQLLQIEKQQSNLLDLLQRFMGNSQNGIDSLETRVSGLERALDEISYDFAVQSGRIPNRESTTGSTCCPSTEFLSPKFWRRTEGRSSTPKSSHLGGVPNKDGNVESLQMDGLRLHEQNEGICRDSWGNVENTNKSVKSIGQNTQRGRTCSPRSFDAASTAPCLTPVVRGV